MVSYSVFLCFILCSVQCMILHTSVTAREVEEAPAASAVNLTYYLFERIGGPGTNGTLFAAAGSGSNETNGAGIGWGTFFVFDSPLRDSSTENSTKVGKSTGTAVVTNLGGISDGGVFFYSNHIFGNASVYYNSSITVSGRIDFMNAPPSWECSVPGGTGFFRGWRGYGICELMTSATADPIVYKWSLFLSK